MFDLKLFTLPTFSGGAVAAFGVSSSIFALLLYLVLYLQDDLGFSALQTGLRLLVLSGGILLTSTIAGRLTSHVPVRLLIGPGLMIVGVGLLLMRGLDATTTWTHLIPGMIISGIGVGALNPPLASTAVGVVSHDRAGMASGINSTFRQVGIATGIALLGTLFSNRVTQIVMAKVNASPGLSGKGQQIATAVKSGAIQQTLATLPAKSRGPVALITKTAFTSGLDLILLYGAIIAFVTGVISLAAIRGKDFAHQPGQAAAK
jgi:predicted MFS family arabinose efflux permease